MVTLLPTKCIVHCGFAVKSISVALFGLRQICRFDYFKGGKFGSLRNLNFIALQSATKPYISRYGPAHTKFTKRVICKISRKRYYIKYNLEALML